MARRLSAGLLMYRLRDNILEVFLAHPGGPYFEKKDDGNWSIPKGEPDDGEDLIVTAMREFKEETGITPVGELKPLGTIIQKGGKEVYCWAFESDLPASYIHVCNFFEEEWPPHSGEYREFPEIDKVAFFNADNAKKKIKAAQIPFIERLQEFLNEQSL
jgi:predicted NUDIX family NTP pyrophosphohydrolase